MADLIPQHHPVNIEDEMKRSYMDYAMSVIIGRALPDARDGLKPAHRRVLYGMKTMGLSPGRAYRKCAKTVGDVMGTFHPHGDASIYDTLVRLAQDFNMRYPLVDGQGNFGSVDGDPPAAMRYTEARLQALADDMMADLDNETVDFAPNYDETTEEPTVLPAPFPNLLVNGSAGIAVGMATNVPPHNLREVVEACIWLIENAHFVEEGAGLSRAEKLRNLMRLIPAPDFPTGGLIVGRQGVVQAHTTGRGSILMRARSVLETNKKGDKQSIIVTQIPYQVNKAKLIERIADLVRDKTIDGISDLRDESDREGMRIVIELRRGEVPEVILNNLYKHTQLQLGFGIIMLAIVGGRPKVLTQVQAQAILDMQLQRLTGLERQKILDELADLLKTIERLRAILASDRLLMQIIVDELRSVMTRYADDRRTEVIDATGELNVEDLIAEEDMAITVSNTGYIKRTAISTYRNQRRGGKGRIGMRTRDEDFVSHLFVASTHAYIMIFSDRGRAYWLKVHEIPDVGPGGKGKSIANLVSMEEGEKIAAMVAVKEFPEDKFIVMGSRRGVVKKTALSSFSNPRAGGIIAMGVEDGDSVIAVQVTDGKGQIFIGTRDGMAIRFEEGDIRPMGRTAYGVRGITLRDDDYVVAMEVVTPAGTLLTVTERGFGKRTEIDEYRVQSRGGVGVINISTSERNGAVAGIAYVEEGDELLLITQQGMILRMQANAVRAIGRATQGVKLIDIEDDDKVVSIAKLLEKEDELDV